LDPNVVVQVDTSVAPTGLRDWAVQPVMAPPPAVKRMLPVGLVDP
jgi:hypothetical protein